MKTVTVLNQKGGVGKTSLCHHLSGELARRGLRVLLVDADPQASLSQGLLGPAQVDAVHPLCSVAAIFAGEPVEPAMIRPTAVEGVDLLVGSIYSAEFNEPRPWELPPGRRTRLARALETIGGLGLGLAYDRVLIDCPPNLNLCSYAALAAADALVVPLQAEDYGAQGLAPVLEFAARCRESDNPALELAGHLLTMVDRRLSVHRMYERRLREDFGPTAFEAVVPRAVAYTEAIAARRPVSHFARGSAAAAAMRAVADELDARLADPVEALSRFASPSSPSSRREVV